jgi:hypothetical protein
MIYQSRSIDSDDDDLGWDGDDIDEAAPAHRARGRSRVALRPVTGYAVSSGGVKSGRIHTPSGSATVQLPAVVPTQSDLERTSVQLESAINRAASRVNATADDVDDLGAKVAVLRAGQRKLARQQESQNMMSLVMTLLFQQQSQKALADHKHTIELGQGAPPVTTSTPVADAAAAGGGLGALLPVLLLGGLGGGGGGGTGGGEQNPMSMMLLVLALSGGLK